MDQFPAAKRISKGALLIGGDYRALGVVRSLGRQGIPVWVFTNEHRVATVSRYVRSNLTWPKGDDAEQLRYLLDCCDQYNLNGWTIFPSDDEAAAFVARNHAMLSTRFRLTTPPWDVLRWSYDKRCMHLLADEVHVDQPRTFLPKNRDEVAALNCSFPAILKPAFKPDVNRFTHSKAWRVDDREKLLSAYDEACALVDPEIIMVQELIPGNGREQVSFAALCEKGQTLASMTARRTRQHPIDFGLASTYVECIDVPEIVAPSRRLLAAIGSCGLVEVEYKRDPRDGAYKLLDINSRVWGWHTLARRAGIDFPHLLWKLVHGEPVPEVRARTGVRWVRMVTDIQAAAAEMVSGRLAPWTYILSLCGAIEFAIMALDDPLPALFDIPFLAMLAWKRKWSSSQS
jgi:D-aspartate ligase